MVYSQNVELHKPYLKYIFDMKKWNLMKKAFLISILLLTGLLSQAQTKVAAHRGFSSIAPENTLIAFQKAIDIGADYFELDVHKTKDDSLVVIHDYDVNRTSSDGLKGKIAEMTYADLVKINVGAPKEFGDKYVDAKIPTLREALAIAKGKIKVCIEVKVYGIEEAVLKTVNDLKVNDEVIIFSFYHSVLAKFRELDNEIPILYLKGKADEKTIEQALEIKATAIGLGLSTVLTKEYLNMAHENGLEVWQWTVNEESKMKELVSLGIDGIITNFPDKALGIR
jgi:glycerophosphoryl diester phosphodiesterase